MFGSVRHIICIYFQFFPKYTCTKFQSSGAVARRCSIKKVVLKNFAKFTEKHLCQSLFLIKLTCDFIKKETLAQVFSCQFCDIFKNTFFTEHLRATASESCIYKTDYGCSESKNPFLPLPHIVGTN